MNFHKEAEKMVQTLDMVQPVIAQRNSRYRGVQPLRYVADEVEGDLKDFSVNLCRLAVTAVAERMKVRTIEATVRGEDVSAEVERRWDKLGMDQRLQSAIVDALAVGSAYLIVWVDRAGKPTITVESAEHMITRHDPITGEVDGAVKRWFEKDHQGVVVDEHVIYYGPDNVVALTRDPAGELELRQVIDNPLGVVPVIPLINYDRMSDHHGHSVVDDLGPLVDALSKILADMLTASEHVARPKRWASGVALEEDAAGFTADEIEYADELDETVKNPFDDANRMWLTESVEAKFGQLPGADLGGYKTAVDVIMQQIMAVSALPAHMVGITSANPSSADAIRAAEASLTARAESRARILTMAIEQAIAILTALDRAAPVADCEARVKWGSFATRSQAAEADAVTKLHSLGIVTTDEARRIVGADGL